MIVANNELLSLEKPAQYVGGELNSVTKNDSEVNVHMALAFPDTYEIGMSHLGIQILYSIVNAKDSAWAERVYMPLGDMEELLREKDCSLFSLESGRPLKDFDIVGFSLQYELCATNILTMLNLAGIPFYSQERSDQMPVIIGGGPYSYHPEPLAPFFDVFLLGDGEEAIVDIVEATEQSKKQLGKYSRADVLSRLRKIEGVYLPSDFEPNYNEFKELEGVAHIDGDKKTIVRRLLPTMEGAPYPEAPIVPNIRTVHNRLSVEVMRGCVRGCRFCQAGYLYRPQRERSPEEIFKIIETALPQTGYEELSLLSLSTADYCSIVPLLTSLMDKYGEEDQLAISFPSTRVDSLTPEVLEQVQRVRRTGFTVAPEAGTQRLRDVINKGVSDEQILETCSNVFKMGWTGIKLYFMIGLPTETDEDLRGIIDIATRIKALPEAKNKDITVSVSTHVPKPHTPFQWAEQISATETLRRQRLLHQGLKKAKVNFRYHDAFSSFLEGVFSRGDRLLAPVIVRAYELGARLDAWAESLSEEIWMEAFLECNIDPSHYLRARDPEEALPWDHLSCGIPKSYFQKEWKRALKDRTTPDCLTTSCSICSACDYDTSKNVLWPRTETEQHFQKTKRISENARERIAPNEVKQRIRIQYSKFGNYAFLGHLELVSVFHRAARRSGIPLAYSAGFHPLPRMSFGPPLSLGIESHSEYLDAFFYEEIEPDLLLEFFNQTLPKELQLQATWKMPLKTDSLSSSIISHRYRVKWHGEIDSENQGAFSNLSSFDTNSLLEAISSETITRAASLAKRKTKGRRKQRPEKTFPLKNFISAPLMTLSTKQETASSFEFTLECDQNTATPKPTEIIKQLLGFGIGDCVIKKLSSAFREDEKISPRPKVENSLALSPSL